MTEYEYRDYWGMVGTPAWELPQWECEFGDHWAPYHVWCLVPIGYRENRRFRRAKPQVFKGEAYVTEVCSGDGRGEVSGIVAQPYTPTTEIRLRMPAALGGICGKFVRYRLEVL